MTEISCRYCKDPTTGMLVHHNECPEYVEKMYEIKALIAKIAYPFSELDVLVEELEDKLFFRDGKLFIKWLRANRFYIKTEIWFIEKRFVTRFDTKDVKEAKKELFDKFREFIIQ